MLRIALHALLALFVLMLPAWHVQAGWDEARAALKTGKIGDAYRELRPLAEEGDKEAQYMIAYLLSTGNGVKLDLQDAYKWYTIAVSRGHSAANGARNHVRSKLNFAAVAEAEREAREWLQAFAFKEAKRKAEEKREKVMERRRLEAEAQESDDKEDAADNAGSN